MVEVGATRARYPSDRAQRAALSLLDGVEFGDADGVLVLSAELLRADHLMILELVARVVELGHRGLVSDVSTACLLFESRL